MAWKVPSRDICRCAVLALLMLATARSEALAASHLWRFSEFYSSPDRTVQFIEMQEIAGAPNETQIQNHWYETNSYNTDHSELLGSPLVGNTANKKFLVGTPSYAALPGVPAPDYMVPDGALDPDGDVVVWWFYQTMTIPPATMPSDGTQSLGVVDPANPGAGFFVGVNSPTNFAGDTGSVVLPSGVPAAGAWGRSVLALVVGGLALAIWKWRFGSSQSAPG